MARGASSLSTHWVSIGAFRSREEESWKAWNPSSSGWDFSDCSRAALRSRAASGVLGRGPGASSARRRHPDRMKFAKTPHSLRAARNSRRPHRGTPAKQWDSFLEGIPEASRLHLEVSVARPTPWNRPPRSIATAPDLARARAYVTKDPSGHGDAGVRLAVRSVQTDVLIVRDTYRDPFHTVVAGDIDFSSTSRRALEMGRADRARRGSQALRAHIVPDHAETYARLRTGLGPGAGMRSSVKPGASTRASRCIPRYSVLRLPLRVLEFAALVNADLVAVGTRGRSNLRDVVLGSTAEKITAATAFAQSLP